LFVVNLIDENDNAPDFSPNTVTIMENTPPGQQRTVQVYDADTDKFGAPFKIEPVFGKVDESLFKWEFDSRSKNLKML
jgi:hypothetical protein